MSDFTYHLAIWVPTSMIVWGLVWCMVKLFGVGGTGAAFSMRNLNTWPLTLVLATGAVFGLIAGGLVFAFGKNSWSRITATVVATLISTTLVPRLWAHLFPPASASSHRGQRSAHGDE